jgi:hypothetical protein
VPHLSKRGVKPHQPSRLMGSDERRHAVANLVFRLSFEINTGCKCGEVRIVLMSQTTKFLRCAYGPRPVGRTLNIPGGAGLVEAG